MKATDDPQSPLLMWIAGAIFTRDLTSNVDEDLISGKGLGETRFERTLSFFA
jgi:hypothetical protein